ncbi:MAG: tRNA (adenine-N1)-methyltransferase [Methanobacteriota archaeon]|nr:MAG: tRNA (adenine-N1)-methyltransferase [Euryarchaeota archaeon]
MDRVVLLDRQGRKWLVLLSEATVSVPGLGVLKAEKLQSSMGNVLRIGGEPFYVLRPSARDLSETLERKAQVVTAKDAAALLYYADVKPGDRIIEGGAGSGGLTIMLAHAVGAEGHVLSYDVRDDFLAVARENVRRAGYENRVEFRVGDVREAIEGPADAVVIDIVDPWNAVESSHGALRSCGHLASYSPNMEQVKETVLQMQRFPFVETRTIEILERELEVREQGVRPSFAALGHTGYLTVGRKVLERA